MTLDKDDAHYSSSVSTVDSQFIQMNWGWGGTVDMAWYATSPSWTINNTTFNTDVKMVYNFQPQN